MNSFIICEILLDKWDTCVYEYRLNYCASWLIPVLRNHKIVYTGLINFNFGFSAVTIIQYKLYTRWRIFLGKRIIILPVKIFLAFKETEWPLQCCKNPPLGIIPGSLQSAPPYPMSTRSIFILFSHLCQSICDFFPWTKKFINISHVPVCATCLENLPHPPSFKQRDNIRWRVHTNHETRNYRL